MKPRIIQPPVALNEGSTTQSIAMAFMNESAIQMYAQYSSHFKSLVKVENPYLAILANIVNISSATAKAHCPQLSQMQDVLKSKYKQFCSICFVPNHVMGRHLRICKSMALSSRRYTVLSLDGRQFLCQFGCPVKYNRVYDLYAHFASQHEYEELKNWGINKELLLQEVSDSTNSVKRMTKDEY